MQILALLVLAVTLVIHFLVPEKEREREEGVCETLLELIKSLRGFYLNINLRKYSIMLLTFKLGLLAMLQAFGAEMIKAGYTKEKLSQLDILNIPISFLVTLVVSKYLAHSCEITMVRRCCFGYFVAGLGSYFTMLAYKEKILV